MGRASNNTIDVHVVQEELIVSYQTATGVAGGSLTASTWQNIPFNTTESNSITGASRSSSVITLPIGDYRVSASAAPSGGTSNVVRVYSASELVKSSLGYVSVSSMSMSFTLGVETNITIDVWTAGSGWIGASSTGTNEIYSRVKITKIG